MTPAPAVMTATVRQPGAEPGRELPVAEQAGDLPGAAEAERPRRQAGRHAASGE